MFEFMPEPKKEGGVKPFRERTPVWKNIVEEGVESVLIDDIIDRVTASPNELYSFSLKSKFREKLVSLATEAINELLQNDQKNFADPIDRQTSGWDREIAHSGEDPDKEITNRGNVLMKSLVTLSGGKANFIEKVVALMQEKERQKKSLDHQKNIQ